MKTSPFKVMTSAALASALAVPAVATTAPSHVDAAETEILDIAIEVDGEVKTVSYDEFVNALFDGSGEVYDLYTEGEIVAVSVEEGQYVKYEALANAVFDAEEGTTTTELLAELNTEEDALVDEEVVAEYDNFVGETGDLAIADLEAVANDTLKVEFNQAVDTEEAELSLKKGTINVSLENVQFAEDGKSATIQIASKFTDSEYTVVVSGATEEDLTQSIELDNEKVSDIEFLSENAVLTEEGTTTYLVASYKVENQYGENITKYTSLNATSSMGTATISQNGKVKINVDQFADAGTLRVGDNVSLTLVHNKGVTETASLEVSKSSAVSGFEVEGLYHNDPDKETLEEDANGFKLEVDVTDQYGNVLDKSMINDQVLVSVSNPYVLEVGDTDGDTTPFDNVYVDGEKQTVLPLRPHNAGTAVVTFISKTTGETFSYEVEVSPGQKVTTINLYSPELAVAGEPVEIPFEAFNANGEEVTDRSVLKDASNGVQVTASGVARSEEPTFKYDPATGETVLELTPSASGYLTVTAQPETVTEDYSVSSVTVDVKDSAYPVAITGIDTTDATPFYKNVLLTESSSFDYADLVAEDQYGRDMLNSYSANLAADADSPSNGEYVIGIEEESSNSNISLSTGKTVTIDGTTYSVLDSSNSATYTGDNQGYENISFTLLKRENNAWETVVGSGFETNLRTVKQNEIEEYQATDIATLYDEVQNGHNEDAAYTKGVVVQGVLADGSLVHVPATGNAGNYYTMTTNNLDLVTNVSGTNGTVNVDASGDGNPTTSDIYYAQGTTESELSTTVTIKATGDMLDKTVTTSYADPTVADTWFIGANGADANVFDPENAVKIAESPGEVNDASEAFNALFLRDQYAAAATIGAGGQVTFADESQTEIATTLTFTNFVEGDDNTNITTSNNGTANASISNLQSGDEYDIVYSFANGEKATLHVVVE